MIDQQVIWEIIGVIFAAGAMYAKLQAIQNDIARLEKKQDKYNNLQERTHILEVQLNNHLAGKK